MKKKKKKTLTQTLNSEQNYKTHHKTTLIRAQELLQDVSQVYVHILVVPSSSARLGFCLIFD